MDHEAYETQMIDGVNSNAECNSQQFETATPKRNRLMDRNDTRILTIGFKRTLVALLTAALFVASVYGFIVVGHAHGYLAVAMFFASVLGIVGAAVLLYAQGIAHKMQTESQGENK